MPRVYVKTPTIERLLARVQPDETGCWLFSGALTNGYGVILHDGRIQGAHRVSYELLVGPIPSGLHIDHLCRVRRCVNPDHLEPVTQRENILRGEGVSARWARRTSCEGGHPWRPENTGYCRGKRRCLICHREKQRAINARKRAVA